MKNTGIIFPHQLFEENMLLENCSTIYLVEEFLFFRQYHFHKQKIAFHRASMKFYQSYLLQKGITVIYIESRDELSDTRQLIPWLKGRNVHSIEYIDTTDYWLEQRINEGCKKYGIKIKQYSSPLFINSKSEILEYFSGRNKFFQTDFYKYQRKSRNILVENGNPLGGKWTFDQENRLRYPKGKIPPVVHFLKSNDFHAESIKYVTRNFGGNIGNLNSSFIFPTTFGESKEWLKEFLKSRFREFGDFEDAILAEEHMLHHSVLSPLLNAGLLTPRFVIGETLAFAKKNEIPLNSVEGFIRQILGWREFIRAIYELKGKDQRSHNFWKFTRKIPPSFWNGTTGIDPIDITIKKIIETGYCHHIERLMVIGNFMLLCEFHPDEVYHWFMTLFIDSFDWVMVPNVYGMSQFADGGLMATKPYISSSNYLMKMSNFKKGDWQKTWDGLFWRFMHIHRNFFIQNPRLGMLAGAFDKMPKAKQIFHLKNADIFLKSLK